jgi:hypothetical protein
MLHTPVWRGVGRPGGVGDLGHARTHAARTPGGPASGLAERPGPHGAPPGYDREARVQGVGPLHRTEEGAKASDQERLTTCRDMGKLLMLCIPGEAQLHSHKADASSRTS